MSVHLLRGPYFGDDRAVRPAGCHRTTKANIRFHRVRRTAGVESSFPSDFIVGPEGYLTPSNPSPSAERSAEARDDETS